MQTTISVGPKAGTPANQQKQFKLVTIESDIQNKLPYITRNYSYSAIEFKDDKRHGDNFIRAHSIILDFDEGKTIEQALKDFDSYYGMIATTKSHQQSTKGGIPGEKEIVKCDRFRVILFLENPIEDKDEFVTIMTNLINKYGSDKACKDTARYYFPNPTQKVWFL